MQRQRRSRPNNLPNAFGRVYCCPFRFWSSRETEHSSLKSKRASSRALLEHLQKRALCDGRPALRRLNMNTDTSVVSEFGVYARSAISPALAQNPAECRIERQRSDRSGERDRQRFGGFGLQRQK